MVSPEEIRTLQTISPLTCTLLDLRRPTKIQDSHSLAEAVVCDAGAQYAFSRFHLHLAASKFSLKWRGRTPSLSLGLRQASTFSLSPIFGSQRADTTPTGTEGAEHLCAILGQDSLPLSVCDSYRIRL
jgi:hypothetical protein